jgi:hypothetical protein
MTGFTSTFGGNPIEPADASWRVLTFGTDQQLTWAFSLEDTTNPTAKLIDLVATASGLSVAMPDATQASVGEQIVFNNTGANAALITTITGGTLRLIPPSSSVLLYLIDNSTAAGSWRVITFGSVTSYSDASVLAGYGIKAIGATLNQNYRVYLEAVPFSINDTYRASIRVWTGGTGAATLPTAASVADGFFFWMRNGGTGLLTVTPTGGNVINANKPNHPILPRESAMFVTSGGQWYTVADTPPGIFELLDNGPYVPIGPDGKIPDQYIPALAITDIFTVASEAAMLALVAQTGDFAIRTDIRTTFALSANTPGVLSAWKEIVGPYIKTAFGFSPAPGTAVSLLDIPALVGNIADADQALVYQASTSSHRRAPLSTFLQNTIKTVFGVTPGPASQVVSILDIPALSGATDDADSVPIYDASTSTHRRTTIGAILQSVRDAITTLTTTVSGLPRTFLQLTDTPDAYADGSLIFSQASAIAYTTGGAAGATWNGQQLGVGGGSIGASGGVGNPAQAVVYGGIVPGQSVAAIRQIYAGFIDTGPTTASDFVRYATGIVSSGDIGTTQFRVNMAGTIYATNTTVQAADYAEWFEAAEELPVGVSVVMDNGLVRVYRADDDPSQIFGIVRPRNTLSAVIGNAAEDQWSKRYLSGPFGEPLFYGREEKVRDPKTKRFRKVLVPTRCENPAYDPNTPYVARSKRPEWNLIGLKGQIEASAGIAPHPSWIKIRALSDTVDLWLVR